MTCLGDKLLKAFRILDKKKKKYLQAAQLKHGGENGMRMLACIGFIQHIQHKIFFFSLFQIPVYYETYTNCTL